MILGSPDTFVSSSTRSARQIAPVLPPAYESDLARSRMHARGREILLRSRVVMGDTLSLVEGAERVQLLTNVPGESRNIAGASGGRRW